MKKRRERECEFLLPLSFCFFSFFSSKLFSHPKPEKERKEFLFSFEQRKKKTKTCCHRMFTKNKIPTRNNRVKDRHQAKFFCFFSFGTLSSNSFKTFELGKRLLLLLLLLEKRERKERRRKSQKKTTLTMDTFKGTPFPFFGFAFFFEFC